MVPLRCPAEGLIRIPFEKISYLVRNMIDSYGASPRDEVKHRTCQTIEVTDLFFFFSHNSNFSRA